jgi:hypothetical protein
MERRCLIIVIPTQILYVTDSNLCPEIRCTFFASATSSKYWDSSKSKQRSQWPRGLEHEPSSLARTLGSYLTQVMDVCIVCVYSVLVLSCVQVAALRRADPSSKESYRLCDQETEKAAKVQQISVEP